MGQIYARCFGSSSRSDSSHGGRANIYKIGEEGNADVVGQQPTSGTGGTKQYSWSARVVHKRNVPYNFFFEMGHCVCVATTTDFSRK